MWDVLEASFLLVGLDPVMKHQLAGTDPNASRREPWAKTFELIDRELGGTTSFSGVAQGFPPNQLLDCADLLGIRVPEVLRQTAQETAERRERRERTLTPDGVPPADPVAEAERALSRRRYNTMLKLIGAMAADHYGWVPNIQGSAASEIEKLTDEFGPKVSHDTVRKILTEAAEQIDVANRFSDEPS